MTLGKYAPQATIERDGEVWMLRPLVLDKAASEAAYQEAMGPGGSGFWMPESEFQFLKPGDGDCAGGDAGGVRRGARRR